MNRRSFFRALGLSPLLVPAAVVAAVQEANKDMAPASKYTSWVTLNRFVEPLPSEFIMLPAKTLGSVALGIGQDDQLWVKSSTDNKWKRVATDEKILV